MTTKNLRFSGQSALTGYAFLWDDNDDIFNPALGEAVTYVPANVNDYKVLIPEIGSSGTYSRAVPSNLPLGAWHVAYKSLAAGTGGIAVESDEVIFENNIEWDGTQIVDDLVIGSSVADICNMALSHLAVGTEIANLETEDSAEAQVCRRFFEQARDKVLRDFAWPFAVRIADLPLVQADPTDEWAFSYRCPANALYIRRIPSGIRNDNLQSRVPYRIIGDDSGRLIYTDMEDAQVEYTSRVSNPLRFAPDFVFALSYLLAFYIAPRLTSGDQFKLGQKAGELYEREIRKAQANAANEEVPDESPEAESIRARY